MACKFARSLVLPTIICNVQPKNQDRDKQSDVRLGDPLKTTARSCSQFPPTTWQQTARTEAERSTGGME